MSTAAVRKRYLEDMKSEELVSMFSEQDEQTWFKHKDTAIFFKNMGNYVSAYDVEDPERAFPVDEGFPRLVKDHYGDIGRFFEDFKGYENLISREIVFIDDVSANAMTLRDFEKRLG